MGLKSYQNNAQDLQIVMDASTMLKNPFTTSMHPVLEGEKREKQSNEKQFVDSREPAMRVFESN